MSSTGKTTKRKPTTTATARAARPAAKPRVAKAATRGSAAQAAAPPTRAEIAARAYDLYVQSGYQPGREVDFWLQAERQLRSEPRR